MILYKYTGQKKKKIAIFMCTIRDRSMLTCQWYHSRSKTFILQDWPKHSFILEVYTTYNNNKHSLYDKKCGKLSFVVRVLFLTVVIMCRVLKLVFSSSFPFSLLNCATLL